MPQPQDLEQATERTKLLHHVANDRRLSAVLQEDEAQSFIGSHVSKDEQALASAPIGERLPYNDYTTIDWLHDLVGSLTTALEHQLTHRRSKTPTGFAPFVLERVLDMESSLATTPALAGSPLPSSGSSLLALPSSWMWQKLA